MLNRRAFFRRAISAAIGTLVLDPEQLLWVPGQRTFFLPDGVSVTQRGLTISQLVAASYNSVLEQSRTPANQWANSAILRYLEHNGGLHRTATSGDSGLRNPLSLSDQNSGIVAL